MAGLCFLKQWDGHSGSSQLVLKTVKFYNEPSLDHLDSWTHEAQLSQPFGMHLWAFVKTLVMWVILASMVYMNFHQTFFF